ncbi:MAG TPA: SDR family oxidoreductase [Caulobacteraceae bacterium]|jgi:3-oxoacyl-[acyl-carrier protein] reductase|nr:SDR family oxidoreductase [Caulobacteraceae bacterium]
MTDILTLGGRVALVTGAGQGVGRQIALQLAAADGSGGVAVNDYVLDRAEAVAAEIRAAGGKALAVQADVSSQPSVQAMVAKAKAELGPIGILVNNAGNAGANPSPELRKPFWETGPEVWQSFIGVNFYGVINCTAAVIPGMIERGAAGRIITIISDAGRWGDANMEIYAASKAGAAGFMRSVARTLGRYGITANSVAIALTATPAVQRTLEGDQERLKRQMEKYIIRRPGQPTDIANMVQFLASDASPWITGQVYPVNGGFTFAL